MYFLTTLFVIRNDDDFVYHIDGQVNYTGLNFHVSGNTIEIFLTDDLGLEIRFRGTEIHNRGYRRAFYYCLRAKLFYFIIIFFLFIANT